MRISASIFPRMPLNINAPPQHLDHRNGFQIRLKNLKIHNRNWLFFVRQILIYFHTMRLQYMPRIRNILSQHRGMEYWMYLRHIRRQSQPMCNHANSSPVSQNVQCISMLTFPSCQTSSHRSSVTPSEMHSHQPEILHPYTLDPHSSLVC